jgi:peptide/nickel transport system ATP-binding protein
MSAPLLSIDGLTLAFRTRERWLRALHAVSFTLARGEVLGLVGESGAGKSLTGAAILGLLPPNAKIESGSVRLGDRQLDPQREASYAGVRGRRIGAVFQDPLSSLNPVLRIGDQLTETIRLHQALDETAARQRALALLEEVGIADAARRMNAYPHEFSGGMRQRVVIALALAGQPELIIADEPTTALDVSTQAQVIALLRRLCHERQMAMIFISHDIDVIAAIADRMAVMYAGRIVEIAEMAAFLRQPRHPYAEGLLAAVPTLAQRLERLPQIAGAMPRLDALPPGCAFHPRCPRAFRPCRETVPPHFSTANGEVACHLFGPER